MTLGQPFEQCNRRRLFSTLDATSFNGRYSALTLRISPAHSLLYPALNTEAELNSIPIRHYLLSFVFGSTHSISIGKIPLLRSDSPPTLLRLLKALRSPLILLLATNPKVPRQILGRPVYRHLDILSHLMIQNQPQASGAPLSEHLAHALRAYCNFLHQYIPR